MKKHTSKGEVKVLGIDLSKQSFEIHGVNESGQTVVSKQLSRSNLSAFVANLPPCLIGMEACGGANHWERVFTQVGHTVRMMAPQRACIEYGAKRSPDGRPREIRSGACSWNTGS